MKKWVLRTLYTVPAILVVAGLVYHVGLRRWSMRWGTTDAEPHSVFPGDELFPTYPSEATHAITINAPSQKVWPWLMHIGLDRSGFYSYTFLKNTFGCEMPELHRRFQDWKQRTRGEMVWFLRSTAFRVKTR